MLIAHTVAVEMISELRPIVDAIKRHDSHLADQLRRAASNTVANLAEGQRRKAGNKNRAFENAHGEAQEVLGHLDTARGWGYIVVLDRLLALCWGLTHSKHERPRKAAAIG
ncbi:MAG TPA: four helix bundle protein [Kofleriaceae bacterium]